MSLFEKPEVIILKESSDAKVYLSKLEELLPRVPEKTDVYQRIEKEIAVTKAGIYGEDSLLFELKNSGLDLVVLHDIYIEDPAGNGAQIDYLVITPYVDVLIECKNLFGNIEINNKGDFVRTIEYSGKRYKEGIYSPVTQNERHMRVFKECRKASKGLLAAALYEKWFDKYNKSLIVLANPKTVVNDRFAPADIKKQVIRGDQLITVLRDMKSDTKTNKKNMLAHGEKLLSMNKEERKDYFLKYEEFLLNVQNIKETEQKTSEAGMKYTRSESIENNLCPRCGGKLVLRHGKYGDFYGCTNYPKCTFTRKQ